jgi:hypothetical protein
MIDIPSISCICITLTKPLHFILNALKHSCNLFHMFQLNDVITRLLILFFLLSYINITDVALTACNIILEFYSSIFASTKIIIRYYPYVA